MTSSRAAFAALTTTALVAAGLGLGPLPAHGEPPTCQGRAATVVGSATSATTTGTEGDDVIVASITENGSVLGLGGNDVVCIVDGAEATRFGVQ
jgi:hypothetical protein